MAALGSRAPLSQCRQNGGLRSITFPGTRHAHEAAFDHEGLVRTAYILCAFGFAVLDGLLMGRSIPANRAFIPWLAISSWSSSCSGRTL
jgi:hypothetical protein